MSEFDPSQPHTGGIRGLSKRRKSPIFAAFPDKFGLPCVPPCPTYGP
jgi:hypothetical protein